MRASVPSWRQDIDRWRDQQARLRGELTADEIDEMDHRHLTAMRDWMEDAAVIAERDLGNEYLKTLFSVVLGRLASPECEAYWVVRDRVAASLKAAARAGKFEPWELEYIDGKIGVLP